MPPRTSVRIRSRFYTSEMHQDHHPQAESRRETPQNDRTKPPLHDYVKDTYSKIHLEAEQFSENLPRNDR